jgi:hypothetical protein
MISIGENHRMAIGPTHTYPFGSPVNDIDNGMVFASFERVEGTRAVALNFGTELNWVALPPRQALIVARTFRQMIHGWFGNLPYNPDILPIRVKSNPVLKMVESTLPTPMEVLTAHPEVFLAWADQMSQTALFMMTDANGRL